MNKFIKLAKKLFNTIEIGDKVVTVHNDVGIVCEVAGSINGKILYYIDSLYTPYFIDELRLYDSND